MTLAGRTFGALMGCVGCALSGICGIFDAATENTSS